MTLSGSRMGQGPEHAYGERVEPVEGLAVPIRSLGGGWSPGPNSIGKRSAGKRQPYID